MSAYKRLTILVLLAAVAAIITPAFASAADGGLEVSRFVLCSGISEREPVGVADSFKHGTQKVYVFAEFLNVTADTYVTLVWFYRDAEIASIDLSVNKSARWRTYSSKLIARQSGQWRVDLLDEKGRTLATQSFTVGD